MISRENANKILPGVEIYAEEESKKRMNTGEVIRYLRKRNGLSQQELAERLMVQRSSVQKMESGIVLNLKLETIQRLCQIFQVAPYAFVFPDVWEKYNCFYEDGPNIYEFKTLYTFLTPEAQHKAFDYAKDLSQIKRYVRKDAENIQDIYAIFPWSQRK